MKRQKTEDIFFDKGAEFWYAHYYREANFRFSNQKEADKFCGFFCSEINKEKENLCKKLRDIIDEVFKNSKNTAYPHSDCFEEKKIEYVQKLNYIKFPDFIDPILENFLLRIDINPCVGSERGMTKIYCIPRYWSKISLKKALSFFDRSQKACPKIVNLLSEYYLKIFNQFMQNSIPETDKMLQNPFVLITKALGSSDPETVKFISLLDNTEEWDMHCKNNLRAKQLLLAFSEMNKPHNKKWKLSEYEWIQQSVLYQPKENPANKKLEANGYIGLKEDENFGHFVVLSDSEPRNVLLPLHLDIIKSN